MLGPVIAHGLIHSLVYYVLALCKVRVRAHSDLAESAVSGACELLELLHLHFVLQSLLGVLTLHFRNSIGKIGRACLDVLDLLG